MKLNKLGNNETEIVISNDNLTRILFSYSTPVACYIQGQPYRTSKKYSSTTSKHINKYVGMNAIEKDQNFFDKLIILGELEHE